MIEETGPDMWAAGEQWVEENTIADTATVIAALVGEVAAW